MNKILIKEWQDNGFKFIPISDENFLFENDTVTFKFDTQKKEVKIISEDVIILSQIISNLITLTLSIKT